ncbi:DUF1549 domain-containing protein [Stratiformator vulcanicus]|uniref:Bacterial Ig-like domain (Group 2) n=1 Tax=Stratiformator vulcanicus TaxID=2527980 RepID=A0A517QW19_9PLAN|nr:DUF1549 domain-containing protein [Stratiformator vulcanicus]QDT35777.1 hypothetical protein Pan189_01300 [Stratiformator vulcanicus]
MRRHSHRIALLALVALTAAPVTVATAAEPAKLFVFPESVDLTTGADRQPLVVQVEYADGVTRDVTAEAKFELPSDACASLEDTTLHPSRNGESTLKVRYKKLTREIPIKASRVESHPDLSFRLDVMPVFMKSGCNMGSCHGAARGKDGFRLSLFGFDPEGDYYRLTRELAGRRINVASPERSMLLEKSVGAVSHTGGQRFDEQSEYYETLRRWVASGAVNDTGEVATCTEVEVFPPGGVLAGKGAAQKLIVRATYSDGTDRDVTNLAYFMTNNETSAAVSQSGQVTAGERGEAFVTARFGTHTVGVPFIVVPEDQSFEWPGIEPSNYIDELVHAKLKNLRMTPSEVCTDEEFLRRVHLDIIGRLPAPEEYERFLANKNPDKRAKLIDELIEQKEFVELWVMKWAELLQVRTVRNRVDPKGMLLYHAWLKERIAGNVPIDQMVREMLSANGGTFENPPTNYYQAEQDSLKVAENVAQVFMGMRIQCAQCHNHPFDRWTMDDYYGFSAFFSQIGRKRSDDPRQQIIYNRGGGDVKHPVTKKNVAPQFLGGAVADVKGKDRRKVLADWLASPDNPYFAKNLANIVWAHFLGRGIIDPVDDVRVTNPAVNQPLLDELGERFTKTGYDFKELVRDICNSRTYQLSTRSNDSNASDLSNFSHAHVRRMRAEVLLDSVTQVTETSDKFSGLPAGARAVQIPDGNTSTYFLTTFGRASRETPCSCEVKTEPNLSQALHMLNGNTIDGKIRQSSVVKQALADKVEPKEFLRDITIRCLVREPTDKETERFLAEAEQLEDRRALYEDAFWALLNSREFLFIQ